MHEAHFVRQLIIRLNITILHLDENPGSIHLSDMSSDCAKYQIVNCMCIQTIYTSLCSDKIPRDSGLIGPRQVTSVRPTFAKQQDRNFRRQHFARLPDRLRHPNSIRRYRSSRRQTTPGQSQKWAARKLTASTNQTVNETKIAFGSAFCSSQTQHPARCQRNTRTLSTTKAQLSYTFIHHVT